MSIDTAMSPSDHHMRAEHVGVLQVLRPHKVAHIFASRAYGQDQADMHTIGFDEDGNSCARFTPMSIGGDQAAE